MKIDTGFHTLLDLYDVDVDLLKNKQFIEKNMKDIAVKVRATILNSYFHEFGNGGITGVIALCESHMSIHTWPELNYASIDVYMCGNEKTDKAINLLIELFKTKNIKINKIKRGFE